MQPKSPPFRVTIKSFFAAARILRRNIGVLRTGRVFSGITLDTIRGRPYQQMPAPADRAERLCRRQIGPAILVYRRLGAYVDPATSLDICREIVHAASIEFLRSVLGELDSKSIAKRTDAEIAAARDEMAANFFNADIDWREFSAKAVVFHVQRCRFVEVCRAAGVPELAPLFCEGDRLYFEDVLGTATLIRPHTIAGGGANCPFEIRWR